MRARRGFLWAWLNVGLGFIGALGTLLGEAGVNIGTFNLGRNKERTTAIALVSVDDPITDDVVKSVQNLEHVRTVKPLRF